MTALLPDLQGAWRLCDLEKYESTYISNGSAAAMENEFGQVEFDRAKHLTRLKVEVCNYNDEIAVVNYSGRIKPARRDECSARMQYRFDPRDLASPKSAPLPIIHWLFFHRNMYTSASIFLYNVGPL